MSAYGMRLTVLATQLAEAVGKDETPEEGGCDLSAGMYGPNVSAWLRDLAAVLGAPIDMVLHCPKCHVQHIDADEWKDDPHDIEQGRICTWKNEPHRSHLCHGCGFIWRPADVPTNGVAAVKTCGRNDS